MNYWPSLAAKKFNIERRKDKCIMVDITRVPLSLQYLIRINAYRLYLNIIHLSDMIYPDGVNVNRNYLIGVKPEHPKTNLKWPSQIYPSIQAWNLRNKTVAKVFKIQNNNKLEPCCQLKEWLIPVSQRTTTYQWYYSPSRQVVNEKILKK